MKLLFEKTSNTLVSLPVILHDPGLWYQLRASLTLNQWNWIYYHIIGGMTISELAIQENTTIEAVNTWGRQVEMMLTSETFRKKIITRT
ncbi:hypothetical protein [Virgibacillus salinus]|uniref:Sigma-70, region 4 n=1 Tax=Virgibacillus salinus TaxID=553311 RepID=A0A1H0Y192_9BACI|nr:hypothetical protein [Virgibacillus salinus]SDQ08934.1 hypothetical protein SAMN05216231_0360 [Virgibacillus salinus]